MENSNEESILISDRSIVEEFKLIDSNVKEVKQFF